MPRERMITRTINVTECEVIALDVVTVETTIKTYNLTGNTYTKETALKHLKKQYETEEYKIVAIQSMNTHEELYGLSEVEFLKIATKLDPTTRKQLDIEEV